MGGRHKRKNLPTRSALWPRSVGIGGLEHPPPRSPRHGESTVRRGGSSVRRGGSSTRAGREWQPSLNPFQGSKGIGDDSVRGCRATPGNLRAPPFGGEEGGERWDGDSSDDEPVCASNGVGCSVGIATLNEWVRRCSTCTARRLRGRARTRCPPRRLNWGRGRWLYLASAALGGMVGMRLRAALQVARI